MGWGWISKTASWRQGWYSLALSSVAFVTMAFGAAVAAAEEDGSLSSDYDIYTVSIENDAVSNYDRHYTSGVRFSKLLRSDKKLRWLGTLANSVGMGRDANYERYELSIGQKLYTPEDLDAQEVLYADRPYAGWAYLSAGMLAGKGRVVDQFEISAGVVGPSALGEETQKLVHRWIGSRMPQGWENQLSDEPTLQVFAQRNWWLVQQARLAGLRWDVVPQFGGALGNVYTLGTAGVTVSAGSGEENSYAFPRLGFTLPGRGSFEAESGFSWQVFASAEGGYVLRNLFLDGSTFSSTEFEIRKERYVSELQLGVQLVWGRNRISFAKIRRSQEFDTQPKPETYGALSFSRAY